MAPMRLLTENDTILTKKVTSDLLTSQPDEGPDSPLERLQIAIPDSGAYNQELRRLIFFTSN